MKGQPWLRCRFKANLADYRPIQWPPPGPYWCSGTGDDHVTLIAYVRTELQILQFWPEARDIHVSAEDEITFTDRFPRPGWYDGEGTAP